MIKVILINDSWEEASKWNQYKTESHNPYCFITSIKTPSETTLKLMNQSSLISFW